MFNIKQTVIWILVLAFLEVPLGAGAASLTLNLPNNFAQQPLPVQWQQNNISLSQLNGLFGQNPGAQQLQIQFPNGMNWNVSPANIQSLYSQYAQKAAALGINQLPDLSFSSLGSSALNAGQATIPIRNAVGGMEQELNGAINRLHDQESSFMDSLPDWLKTIVQAAINGFMVLYTFARDQVNALLR